LECIQIFNKFLSCFNNRLRIFSSVHNLFWSFSRISAWYS